MKIGDITFNDGQAVRPMSWANFLEFIRDSDNLKGYIFRGHERASWPLTSTLYREFRQRGVFSAPSLEQYNKQLRWFRLSIRGRIALQERESSSDNEIWAIGQHHGLATPLLDWTTSPFVAAFFAFDPTRKIQIAECSDVGILDKRFEEAKANRDEARAVFALNARRINEVFYESVRSELRGIGKDTLVKDLRPKDETDDPWMGSFFVERIAEQLFPADDAIRAACRRAIDGAETDVARIISPLSGENRRLINQRGLFTKLFRWQPLEDWIRDYVANTKGLTDGPILLKSDEPILLKIEIPDCERPAALKHLAAANINGLTLFPDLEGAARFSNGKIQ